MREALYAQTSGIAAAALLDHAVIEGPFGVTTAGCVQQGARVALSALIAALRARGSVAVGATRLWVTGAGAEEVMPLLDEYAELWADLSLEGFRLRVLGERP